MEPGFERVPERPAVEPFGTPGCAGGPTDCAPEAQDDPSRPANERWRAAVDAVEKVSAMAAPALKQGVLLWIRDVEIAIQYPPGSTYGAAVERKRADIEAAFQSHFGRPIRLKVDLHGNPAVTPGGGGTSIAAEEQEKREAYSREIKSAVGKNANIADAVSILGGEIARIEEL
jgi:hypothetical protein